MRPGDKIVGGWHKIFICMPGNKIENLGSLYFSFFPFIVPNKHNGILTLCRTILTFNDPGKESFYKHCGKRRKCW